MSNVPNAGHVRRVTRILNPADLIRSKTGAIVIVAPDPSDLGVNGVVQADANISVQAFHYQIGVNQGQLADCFELAPLIGLAAKCKNFLVNHVTPGPNGSLIFAVIYNGQPADVEIDDKVNFSYYAHTEAAGQDDFAAVIEKLFAFLRSSADTMADLNYGWPAEFWSYFGVPAVSVAPTDIATIVAALRSSNQIVTACTGSQAGPDNVATGHAYAVLALSADGKTITAQNPWGNQTPGGNPQQNFALANFPTDFDAGAVIATVPASAPATAVTPTKIPPVTKVVPSRPAAIEFIHNSVPSNLKDGETFTFGVTVKNIGWGSAGQELVNSGTLALRGGQMPSISYLRVGTVNFYGVAPGAGTYTVKLQATDNGALFGPVLERTVTVTAATIAPTPVVAPVDPKPVVKPTVVIPPVIVKPVVTPVVKPVVAPEITVKSVSVSLSDGRVIVL